MNNVGTWNGYVSTRFQISVVKPTAFCAWKVCAVNAVAGRLRVSKELGCLGPHMSLRFRV